jgi:hypothetical protein
MSLGSVHDESAKVAAMISSPSAVARPVPRPSTNTTTANIINGPNDEDITFPALKNERDEERRFIKRGVVQETQKGDEVKAL